MPVTQIDTDKTAHTVTVTAEFAAPPDRVWQVWSDPRQLERWWGPPEYPATVTRHEFAPGGTVDYSMTGPDGATYPGRWAIESVDAPRSFTFVDVFVDAEGNSDDSLPVGRCVVTLAAGGPGTLMTTVTSYPTAEALETVIGMGMQEGVEQSTNQIDALLA